MGWIATLFGRQAKRDAELLSSLLKLQSDRISADAEIAKLDREITLRTKAMELENLELIAEQKRKDAIAKEDLRQKRREWAAQARAKVAQKKAGATSSGPGPTLGVAGCVVCADPRSPRLTAEEIIWHNNGHPGAMSQ
jgi:hypothetical protein